MKRKPALFLGCLMALSVNVGAAAEEAPSVKHTPLQGNLHLLQGRGGNVVASVGEDGVLIVDDGYPQYAPAYQQAIKNLQGEIAAPRFVLNTHWHGDHTGGNGYWGERGAVIVAHTNVRQRMSTRQEMKALDTVVEASPAVALPMVTFGDSLALHFNGEAIEVQHYARGHTDGDSMVFFSGQNVLHMGDHFFKDAYPFVDIGSGGNVFGFIDNIEAALARVDDNTVIIPGHGSISDKADLQRYHHMLMTTSASVKASLNKGMSVEEITAEGLGEEWASWGQGFIKEGYWIAFIAGSL